MYGVKAVGRQKENGKNCKANKSVPNTMLGKKGTSAWINPRHRIENKWFKQENKDIEYEN